MLFFCNGLLKIRLYDPIFTLKLICRRLLRSGQQGGLVPNRIAGLYYKLDYRVILVRLDFREALVNVLGEIKVRLCAQL